MNHAFSGYHTARRHRVYQESMRNSIRNRKNMLKISQVFHLTVFLFLHSFPLSCISTFTHVFCITFYFLHSFLSGLLLSDFGCGYALWWHAYPLNFVTTKQRSHFFFIFGTLYVTGLLLNVYCSSVSIVKMDTTVSLH